jgi:hypothetical protein
MDPKYISKDTLSHFLSGMERYETTELLNDLNVLDLLGGKTPKDHDESIPPYEAAEAFLILFQEREDYELCDMLLKKWPQLKNSFIIKTTEK